VLPPGAIESSSSRRALLEGFDLRARQPETNMAYSPLLVRPMREELLAVGFEELKSADDVDRAMDASSGTALVVVNSVCGCAAGMARPGVRLSLQDGPRPDRLLTVFAGFDVEATRRLRERLGDIPPSSPSMALFKDGELVWFLARHRIEGRDALAVAADLRGAFAEHCAVPA
jgi:putative YphP/YqiW family bacilliredoxin